MAKIRAYKLAEEFGIDRQELVDKANELGIVLKSAMASVEEDDIAVLREKFGGAVKRSGDVEEQRVESKGGKTVLRRRRRPKPVEPEVVAPDPQEVVAEEVSGPVAAEPEPIAAEESAAEESDSPVSEPGEGLEAVPAPVAEPAPRSSGIEERSPAAAAKPDSQPATQDRKGRQRKRVREVVNLQEQERFARQITGRGGAPRRATPLVPRAAVNPRRKRRDKLAVPAVQKPASEQNRVIKVEGEISVGELAKLLGAKAPAVQGKLMALGIMVSINQTVDIETSEKLAAEFGYEVLDTGFKEEAFLEPAVMVEEGVEVASSAGSVPRAPIITIMGHVDHGKTSLLDAIRSAKSNVADNEAGGITQHIGAYQVEAAGHKLTFIDTPGHAAFTAMRARGAAVTDIVVLVVAANDGVMPQTVEAIEHAQAAGCPIVVAINKMDLDDADPGRAKQRLTEHNLVAEEFGGDVICVNVSAKTGEGLDQLLEMLGLQSEVLELGSDPSRRGTGAVLEARLDRGRGPVATVLVRDGTLRRGDVIVVGTEVGRIRHMEDYEGNRLDEAGPSTPVQLIGFSGIPSAGDIFHAVGSERLAKQISEHREAKLRAEPVAAPAKLTLEEFFARAEGEGPKELTVVLKADVQGTCEAARSSLEDLSTEAVTLKVLSAGVGAVNENDVTLAGASGAIVLGFHVRPDPTARRTADNNGVEIRTYSVIMELLDEVRAAMAGLLPPTLKETLLGRAEVRQTFTIPRIGTIAGSLVVEGKVQRSAHCRLVRDGVQVYQGEVQSLRRFKDDAKEVSNGMECGIGISNFNDVKVGDEIEVFDVEEVPATL